MKNSEPLYLSANEAAAELAISPATLYAYVSRGLVRSEPVGDTRARRYRADDVRALKNRRAPPGDARGHKPFDADMPVMDSAVATITDEGPLYRGVNAVSLSQSATLEQAATLLWDVSGSDPFSPTNMPVLSEAMRAVMSATRNETPMARTVAVLALASDADPRAYNLSQDGRTQIGARIMRLITACILNTAPSADPIHRQMARAWAPGHKHAEDLFRRALVLLADHELNASTFTLRCAASTGLNLYDAVIAGLVALKGPKHGGAGPMAAQMLERLAEGDIAALVRERVSQGELIPGFGHTVYKSGDPRAQELLGALHRAGADKRLTIEAPLLITEATGLFPNIDFTLALLMRMLGLSIGHEMSLFAVARTAGWIAHGIEQLKTRGLIRPRARYVGPPPGRASASNR
ncbi:MAG: citrate synthase family protein [Proteobacteria bacterium]|nr:citrate synthase family protein [Pseudomonadota bacterium]